MLHRGWQFRHELFVESFDLLVSDMEFFLNRCQHGLHDYLHGFIVSDIGYFSYHKVKEFAGSSLILIVAFGYCKQHIACKNHCYMCGKSVVGQAMIFLAEQQTALASLEKAPRYPSGGRKSG